MCQRCFKSFKMGYEFTIALTHGLSQNWERSDRDLKEVFKGVANAIRQKAKKTKKTTKCRSRLQSRTSSKKSK